MNKKEILITGSESYIGSVLGSYLRGKGFYVTGYDAGFFTGCILYKGSFPKTIHKDVRDISEDDLKGIETVIHLAGISNDPFKNFDPAKVYDPVRKYSFKLAKLCKKKGIKFIFPSSCSVYGKSTEYVNEESVPNPLTPYSVNKIQIESDLEKITDEKFTPIIFRFATAFGLSPRMRFDLAVNFFTGKAYSSGKISLNSDGKAWRPYVNVLDICKAVCYAIGYQPPKGEKIILNVGITSENYRLLDIIEMIKEQLPDTDVTYFHKNKKATDVKLLDTYIQDGVDIRDYKVSFDLIRKEFSGFECEYPVKEGISVMLEKFKNIGLTEILFKDLKFYRLPNLEQMIKEGLLSPELRWLKKAA